MATRMKFQVPNIDKLAKSAERRFGTLNNSKEIIVDANRKGFFKVSVGSVGGKPTTIATNLTRPEARELVAKIPKQKDFKNINATGGADFRSSSDVAVDFRPSESDDFNTRFRENADGQRKQFNIRVEANQRKEREKREKRPKRGFAK